MVETATGFEDRGGQELRNAALEAGKGLQREHRPAEPLV